MAADGEVRIDVNLDESSFEKGIKSIVSELKNLSDIMSDLLKKIEKSFSGIDGSKGAREVSKVTKESKKAAEATEDLAKKMQEITIDRGMSNPYSDYIKSADEAQEHFEELKDSLDALQSQKISLEFDTDSIEKYTRLVDVAQQKMALIGEEGLSGIGQYKEAYKEASKEIETYQEKLTSLRKKQAEVKQSSKESFDPEPVKRQISYIEELKFQTEGLKQELKELEAQDIVIGSPEWDQTYSQIKRNEKTLSAYEKKLSETEDATQSASNSTSAFTGVLSALERSNKKILSSFDQFIKDVGSNFVGIFSNIGNSAQKAVGEINLFESAVKNTKNSTNMAIASLLKFSNLLKRRILYRAVSSVFNGIKEGFQNLALYSDELNYSISTLISSMAQLKNSFAAAAAPIVNTLAPALNYIVNAVNTAVSSVSQLISALAGQSTYIRAKQVQKDYASTLTDTADAASDAAKEVRRSLAPFDELNQLQSNAVESMSGIGGGDTAIGDLFETVPIENKWKDLANKIKNIASRIFAPIKQAWDDYGQSVISAWKYGLSEVWQALKEIGDTWLKVWEGGAGYETTKNILLILHEIGMWIGDIASAWRKAWDTYGEKVVWSIFNLLNSILRLIYSISVAFREAWNENDRGARIIGNILKIITNINNIASALIDNFTKAWNENDRGKRIASAIFGIVESILGTVERITAATAEWAKTIDFAPLLDSIGGLLEQIEVVVDDIGDSVYEIWTQIVLPFLKYLIQEGLPKVIDFIGEIAPILSGIVEIVKNIGLRFKEAWVETGAGEKILNTIDQIISNVVGTVNRIVDATKEWSKSVDFAPLLEAVAGLLESMKPIIKYLSDKIADLWENKVLPFLTYLIEDGLPKAIKAITKVFDYLSEHTWIIDAVINLVKLLVGGFLALKTAIPIIIAVAGVLLALVNPAGMIVAGVLAIGTAIMTVMQNFEEFAEIGRNIMQGIADGITGSLDWLGEQIRSISERILQWFRDVFQIHSPSVVMQEMGVYLIEGLINGILSLIGSVVSYFEDLASNIKIPFNKLPNWFENKFGDTFKGIKNAFKETRSFFSEKYSDITDSFQNITGWFSEKFRNAYSNVTSAFVNARTYFNGVASNIKSAFNTIPEWFQSTFASAWEKVRNVFSAGGQIFSDIETGILNGLKHVINGLINGINAVIRIPFNGLNTAFSVLRGFSISGFRPFSFLPQIQAPAIPRLATGTVVPPNYGDFLATLGDNKKEPEIVSPLSTIEQAVRNVTGSGTGGPSIINVYLDGKKIHTEMVKENKQALATGRAGFSPA